MTIHTPKTLSAAWIALVLCISACGGSSSEPGPTRSALPEICIGTFQGTTPAYSMRGGDGQLISINGTTVDMPSVRNTVVITKTGLWLTQEAGGTSVSGSGSVRLVHDDDGAVVIEAEVRQAPNSRPTYQFRFDRLNEAVTMSPLLSTGEPDTPLRRIAD